MRIRKNGKFSPLLSFQSSQPPQPALHCQLNQSPWDLLLPIPSSSTTSPSSLRQFEREASLIASESSSDTAGAVEIRTRSVMSLMESEGEIYNYDKVVGDNDSGSGVNYHEIMIKKKKKKKIKKKVFDDITSKDFCCDYKKDGSNCQNRVKEGESMCDHHVTTLKSSKSVDGGDGGGASNGSVKKLVERVSSTRMVEKRRSASSSGVDGFDYYYYSGFGPWRSKRRGGKRDGHKKIRGSSVDDVATSDKRTASPTAAPRVETIDAEMWV